MNRREFLTGKVEDADAMTLGKNPPAETTNRPFTIYPRMVQHCNSRTGYAMIRHWFNPVECWHCADILVEIGKLMGPDEEPNVDRNA